MKDWNAEHKRLVEEISVLDVEISKLSDKMSPFEKQIEALKEQIKPFQTERNKFAGKRYALNEQRKIAKYEAVIQNLQMGDKLWILRMDYVVAHDEVLYRYRTLYEVMDFPELYGIPAGPNLGLQKHYSWRKYLPFQIEIVGIQRGEEEFTAIRGRGMFIGKVARFDNSCINENAIGHINSSYFILWRKQK